jgi:hypothetical protein
MILVVDDDVQIREYYYASALRLYGHDVIAASDGCAALKIMERWTPRRAASRPRLIAAEVAAVRKPRHVRSGPPSLNEGAVTRAQFSFGRKDCRYNFHDALTLMAGADRNHDRVLTPRIDDLRAQFEAQLRSLDRFEDCLRRLASSIAPSADDAALQREVTEMLSNNAHIREVLMEISADLSPTSEA